MMERKEKRREDKKGKGKKREETERKVSLKHLLRS